METIWNNLFIISIPILEKIIRPIAVYLFLIIGLRLAGKRELAQLNPFDLVVLLTISNTVQNAIIGNDNSLLGGLIGGGTLLLVNWIVVRAIHQSKKVENMMEGKETRLIDNGEILNEVLKKEAIDLNELLVAAHKAGIENLDQVDVAILETDGGITIISKETDIGTKRHQELLSRIQGLEAQILRLESALQRS
jgi:uncharacterized membrane protein YcaP (DUF421 family)